MQDHWLKIGSKLLSVFNLITLYFSNIIRLMEMSFVYLIVMLFLLYSIETVYGLAYILHSLTVFSDVVKF